MCQPQPSFTRRHVTLSPHASSQVRSTTTTCGCYSDFRKSNLPRKRIRRPSIAAHGLSFCYISPLTPSPRKPSWRAARALRGPSQSLEYACESSACSHVCSQCSSTILISVIRHQRALELPIVQTWFTLQVCFEGDQKEDFCILFL